MSSGSLAGHAGLDQVTGRDCIGCATLAFCDDKGDLLGAVRMARAPEPNKRTLTASPTMSGITTKSGGSSWPAAIV